MSQNLPHLLRDMPARTVSTTQDRPHSGSSGQWFLIILGLSIALVGALFVWLLARSYLRAKDMRTWPEVPCVILTSEIEERIHDSQSPPEYRQSVSFGYEWQEQARTGDRVSLRGSAWSSKPDLVRKRAEEYPVGMRTTCRIKPTDADFAVLKPDSLAPGYSIWFPGLFVVGGLGIAIKASIHGKSRGRQPRPLASGSDGI